MTAVVLPVLERQRRAVVLEQHHRAAGGLAGRGHGVGLAAARRRPWPGRRRGARTARRGT